jgi:hypothetical protein
MEPEWGNLREEIDEDLEHEWDKEIGTGVVGGDSMTLKIGPITINLTRSVERPRFFTISLHENGEWSPRSMFDCKIVPYLYANSSTQMGWPQPNKAVALFMGKHGRLGAGSLLRVLDEEVVRMIQTMAFDI